MNTPSSGTFKLAALRLGLIQRLFIVGALLTIETLLLSGLIQNTPLDALSGAPRLLRTIQHWAFRYVIAYAMSFAILVYLRRGGTVELMSAAARDAPIRIRWLLAHTLLLCIFAVLSAALYSGGAEAFAALAIAWHLCGCAAALALFAALAPRHYWFDALRSTGALPLYATLPAAGAMLAYKASQQLWTPAAALTFQIVRRLLHPFLPSLRGDATTLTLITDRVAIQVTEVCSGLEGVGLMLVFCSAWLWIYRREYIFPRALIIVPAAVLLIFVLHVVRIAVLVLIAEAGYEQVAIVGFHSQAGWIAFNLAALGVAIVAKRSSWLNRSAHERGPHWADPIERWGEALAAQGQFQAAAQKYAEAFTYAPKWGALHLHWGEALDKLGDHAKALEQYRTAQELALSDPDRQMVVHLVVTASR